MDSKLIINEKIWAVNEMQRITANIERVERELEILKNVDVKYVDSIMLEYVIPGKPIKNVLFPTPNGKGAKSTVDFITEAYEDAIAMWNELLHEIAKKL